MTKIIHNPGTYEFIGYSDNAHILITDNNGSFAFIGNNVTSKFNGIFHYDFETKKMYKVISSIQKADNTDIIKVNNTNTEINDLEFEFIFKDSLKITPKKEEFLTLNLDIREIYDFSKWNKNYKITKEDNNNILVEYKKEDFSFYININSKNIQFNTLNNWTEEHYSLDEKRNSPPFNNFVYQALEIQTNEPIIITYAKTKTETKVKLENALKENKKEHNTQQNIQDTRIHHTYLLSQTAMKSLRVKNEDFTGYFAGLPWFFQFWTRDEAISLGALINQEKYDEVKTILNRHLQNILYDGRNSNRFPESKLGSADGIGLSFSRLFELLKNLDAKGNLQNYFSKLDLILIKNKLDSSIKKIKENYEVEGLIKNLPKETWMDTDETITNVSDNREGFCIEIQVYFANMLKLQEYLYKLTKHGIKNNAKKFIQIVQKKFVNNFLIIDRLKPNFEIDTTTRPNIFLAYYFNKDLFSKKIWETTFNDALSKLKLNWGGISTIDTKSEMFCKNYTGQNNFSYHRGDSWFFINNIAAMCLFDLNKEVYKTQITKIIESSTADILFNGVIGHASEVSDAEKQTSQASPSQLWSIATYIEMIDKINF